MMHPAGRGRFAAMSLIVAGLVAAGAAAVEAADAALEALQGTWRSGGAEAQGLGTWTFDGNTLKVDFPAMSYIAEVKVDGSASPARIDCTITEGQAEVVGETVLGLIAVEGDRATLCVSAPGSPRPTSLEPAEGVFRFSLARKAD